MHSLITTRHIEDYQRDGVVLIKGLFAGYIDRPRWHRGEYAVPRPMRRKSETG